MVFLHSCHLLVAEGGWGEEVLHFNTGSFLPAGKGSEIREGFKLFCKG